MDEPIIKAYAMLTAHEFAIEVLLANTLADMPRDLAHRFMSDFHTKAQEIWSQNANFGASDTTLEIGRQVAPLLSNLLSKVETRSEQIRSARSAI